MITWLARAVFTRPKVTESGSYATPDPVVELLQRASLRLSSVTVPRQSIVPDLDRERGGLL